jgi:hypothetical protein
LADVRNVVLTIGSLADRVFSKIQKLFAGQQILKILTYAGITLVLSILVAYGINELMAGSDIG